jgi:hypothetical protein
VANPNFKVSVSQAPGIPGTATITVSSEVAGTVYRVSFNTFPTSASFVDGTMDSSWSVLNENKATYGLTKGDGLRLPAQRYEIGASTAWENLVIRPAAGNWDVVGKMFYQTRPTGNYQQGMLVVWQDNNNYIKLDCETASCTIQLHRQQNGSGSSVVKVNTSADADGSLTLYLMISKDGDEYIASYSKDGVNYVEAARTTASFENVYVGFFATANSTSNNFQTYYEYLTVTRLNGVNIKSYEDMLQDAFNDVVKYVAADIPSSTVSNLPAFSKMPHRYTAEIVSSSNPDVIDLQGKVTPTRNDSTVNLCIRIADNAPVPHETTVVKTVAVPGFAPNALELVFDIAPGAAATAALTLVNAATGETVAPDAPGGKVFSVASGTYQYTAILAGYKAARGYVVVTDADVTQRVLMVAAGGNPIFKSIFTADPESHAWPTNPDKLYVYPSHDPYP